MIRNMKNTYCVALTIALLLFVSHPVVVSAHHATDEQTGEIVMHATASNSGFLNFITNTFSRLKDSLNIGTKTIVEDLPVVETLITEQLSVDPEIKKLEVDLGKADTAVRVQTTILENPILNKVIPDRWVNNGITWKSIEEMDLRLAKLAEKSPTSAREYIEKNKLVGKHQLLRTPVTGINKKDVVVTIGHFDYDNSDKADYFGTYIDGSVVKTIFSEQFRRLGGEYKIADFSGYQFGNNILITQMTGFEQVIQTGQMQQRSTSDVDYRVLVLLVNYLDSDPAEQLTDAQTAHDILFNGDLHNFFYEQSYGKMNMVGDVYGWYTLNSNAEGMSCNPLNISSNGNSGPLSNQQLMNYIVADNIQVASYDQVLIIGNCKNVTGGGFGARVGRYNNITGWDAIGFSQNTQIPLAVVKTSNGSANLHTMSHEMGHFLNFGIGFYPHANAYDCEDQVFSASCNLLEYGNYFDAMGSWQAYGHHYRAAMKKALGWITDDQVLEITEDGYYNLTPLEQDNTNVGGYKMARIKIPHLNYTPYILEFRSGYGYDWNIWNNSELQPNIEGLFIYKTIDTTSISELNAVLLDMNPTTQNWGVENLGNTNSPQNWDEDIKDVTLQPFQDEYIDEQLGIKIKMVYPVQQVSALFQVTYLPTECIHYEPSIIFGTNPPLHQSPPSSYYMASYSVFLRAFNNDTVGCNSSHFTSSVSAPSPLSVYQQEMLPGVAIPGNLTPPIGSVSVTVPLGTPVGEYPIMITVTNQDSGQTTTDIQIVTVN
jgi:M6 family metalloprotease-like protein